jgi:ATP-dependent exoDNAse (exonuclease V) alpha subunit
VVELRKVYRQKDEKFLKLLNAVRNHSLSEEDLDQLNNRVAQNFVPSSNDFFVFLTTTNALADKVNHNQLTQLDDDSVVLSASMSGDINVKQMPVAQELIVKPHAQVMLVNNDSQGRWMNGSVGKIESIVNLNAEHRVIRVRLTNGNVVDVTPFTWEIFKFFYSEQTQAVESESIGSFTQYPIRLAWAITIHKSQGKTFDRVVIDSGYGAFAHGQMYVALSRCVSFEGIVLRRKLRRSDLILDERILNFLALHDVDTGERRAAI